MRQFILVALLCLALLIGGGIAAAVVSPSSLLNLGQWYLREYSDYRVELRDAHISLAQVSFSAAEIHLFQHNSEGPALLSVLDVKVSSHWRDLIEQNLNNTSISANAVMVYQSDTDAARDPSPNEWLSQLEWLPETLQVGSIHLVSSQRETWIFPLKQLQGKRVEQGHYRTTATAEYEGRPLEMKVEIYAIREREQRVGVDLRAELFAPATNSTILIQGEARATEAALDYHFDIEADYADIGTFLAALETPWDVAGALTFTGTVRGDLRGYQLIDTQFQLDNSPHYRFTAAGDIAYSDDEPGELALQAEGQMQSMEYLFNWIDVDLRGLGATQAQLNISGTLARPVLSDFLLTTRNSNHLHSEVSGYLELGEESRENYIDFQLEAPSLASLSPWVEVPAVDPGAWQLSGRLTKQHQALRAESLALTVGSPERLLLTARGNIEKLARLDNMEVNELAVDGVNLHITARTPDIRVLQPLTESPLPAQHRSEFQATLLGGANNRLQLKAGVLQINSPDLQVSASSVSAQLDGNNDALLTHMEGKLQAALSDLSYIAPYLDMELPAGIRSEIAGDFLWAQTLSLPTLEARLQHANGELVLHGQVPDAVNLDGLNLHAELVSSELNTLIPLALPSYHYIPPLGALHAVLDLAHSSGNWTVTNLAASTSAESPLQLSAQGQASLAGEDITGEGSVQVAALDPELATQLTGLALAAFSSSTELHYRDRKLSADAAMTAGTTRLTAQGELTHDDKGIEALTMALHSPHLKLEDLGLQWESNNETSSESVDAASQPGWLDTVLANNPEFATDFRVDIDGLSGDNTDIRGLNLHLTGQDNRYTLRQFNVDYGRAQGLLRGIIDLNPDPPAISLAGEAVDVPMDALIADLGVDFDIEGDLTFRGGLTGRGKNTAQLLAALNGNMALALEQATIEGAAYDMLATDLLTWIFSGAALADSTVVDCAMARFDLLDGVAQTENLFVESPRMVATGTGHIDLAQQQLDMSLTPRSKSRRLQVPNNVRIRGPLDNPKTSVSAVATTFDLTMEALATLPRMLRRLTGRSTENRSDFTPCEANLGN